MTHTLYYKFILGYLLFGFLGFVTIATVSSNLTYEHLIEQKAEALYDEATMIADNCSKVYEGKYLDLATAYPQLDAVATYMKARIWIMDHSGIITADSSRKAAGTAVEGFDPTAQGNRLYTIGRYYGMFDSDVLSVSSPITGNMNTYGYITIHLPISVIKAEQNGFLNIVYITSGIIFCPVPDYLADIYENRLFPAQENNLCSQ